MNNKDHQSNLLAKDSMSINPFLRTDMPNNRCNPKWYSGIKITQLSVSKISYEKTPKTIEGTEQFFNANVMNTAIFYSIRKRQFFAPGEPPKRQP